MSTAHIPGAKTTRENAKATADDVRTRSRTVRDDLEQLDKDEENIALAAAAALEDVAVDRAVYTEEAEELVRIRTRAQQIRGITSEEEREPENPAPEARIEVLDVLGRRVLLDASGSTGTDLSYEWETGEGGRNGYVRGEVRYAHTFTDSDTNEFLVRLRVTDAQGRNSVAERQVTVAAVQAPEPEPRPEPEPDPAPAPPPAPRPRRPYNGRPRTLNEWLGAIVGGIIGLIVGLFTREFPPHITGVGLTVFAACWVFVLVGLGFYTGGSIAHNYDHEEDEE